MAQTNSSDVVFDLKKVAQMMPALTDAEKRYALEEEEIAFFKQQSGIEDDQQLKEHILKVQAEAYAVFPYPCIGQFAFTKLKISKFPAFQQLLQLGKARTGALFLDVGCCFGNDVRKAVAEGFPLDQAIGSDIIPEFWEMGHKLFRTTQETYPVRFIPGNALDPDLLSSVPPFASPPSTPAPSLSTLKTLTPLHGHVSAVHASSLFHLFDEENQTALARALASLLSPMPGSIIFGSHGALPEKGLVVQSIPGILNPLPMFCHNPESWSQLWEKEIFNAGQVRVEATLKEVPSLRSKDIKGGVMVWCVTRL